MTFHRSARCRIVNPCLVDGSDDGTWTNGIHADAGSGIFKSKSLREVLDCALAGGIREILRFRDDLVNAGVVNDGSAAGATEEMADCFSRTKESAVQVYVQNMPEGFQAKLMRGRGLLNSGIVDQNVKLAEFRGHLGEHPEYLGFVGYIGFHQNGARAGACFHRLGQRYIGFVQFRRAPVIDGDIAALFRKTYGDSAADAGRRAGYQNALTCQTFHQLPHGNNTASSRHNMRMRNIVRWPVTLMLAGTALAGDSGHARVPVLLELFTSEGCSSCPPADSLLAKLDREQGIAGADVIVLSEHVDYWNHLGWADPFSSALYSERQREYASHLDGQTYTPELVVDGAKGFVGSDEREAGQAIREAAQRGKTAVRISAERVEKKTRVTIHIDDAPEGTLYLALAHDARKSEVLRGENAGRGLSHVAVAYSIEKVAKLEHGRNADVERMVTVKPGALTRIVAFVAQPGSGRVLALGQTKL